MKIEFHEIMQNDCKKSENKAVKNIPKREHKSLKKSEPKECKKHRRKKMNIKVENIPKNGEKCGHGCVYCRCWHC